MTNYSHSDVDFLFKKNAFTMSFFIHIMKNIKTLEESRELARTLRLGVFKIFVARFISTVVYEAIIYLVSVNMIHRHR